MGKTTHNAKLLAVNHAIRLAFSRNRDERYRIHVANMLLIIEAPSSLFSIFSTQTKQLDARDDRSTHMKNVSVFLTCTNRHTRTKSGAADSRVNPRVEVFPINVGVTFKRHSIENRWIQSGRRNDERRYPVTMNFNASSASMSDATALPRAICDVYDAAIDPSLWAKALQTSCEFVGALKANLFWQDNAAEQVLTLHQFNADPHFTRLYMEVYAPLNPVLPAAMAQEAGAVNAVTDLIPLSELVETRFHKEWIAPQGIGDSICVLLEKDAQGAAFLAFEVTAPVADESAKQRTAQLVPHYQRAVAIGRLFVKSNATLVAFADTLDHVDAAIVMIASHGRIVFANVAARRMIEEGVLLRDAGGRLGAPGSGTDRALQDSFDTIENSTLPVGARGASVVLSDEAGVRWIANVLPLVDGDRRRNGEAYDASAAVFVRRSQTASPMPMEVLAKQYRLTASESRVVGEMLSVTGIDAMADMLGTSRATVKTHLNHILRKCGVNNQRDLVKLFAGLETKR